MEFWSYCVISHCKIKCNVGSVAEPLSHIQLVPSLKPWPTSCSFRSLKLSHNLERSFTPHTLCTEKTEFNFIFIKGNILPLISLNKWPYFTLDFLKWSVAVSFTGKPSGGKAVYYFVEKSNFWFHLLAETDSWPSSLPIGSLDSNCNCEACVTLYSFWSWFRTYITRFVIYYISII